jgi:predicted anti-sigma-YlaC factor YlaD
VFASDDDPELIREALPFSLKTLEALLNGSPKEPGLLLAAASGFTSYAFGFLDTDALALEPTDYPAALLVRERERRMFLRARNYGLRGLELTHPGIGVLLREHPEGAANACTRDDVPFLYWTGAAWGGAISTGKDHPELLADLPAVRTLLGRALELDESFKGGAIHAALIPLEAQSPAMGGSPARAQAHFKRTLELSRAGDAALFVTYALSIALPAQDRVGFESMLKRALAVDPDLEPSTRLANLLAQRRARLLMARLDDLFLESKEETPQ